MSIDARDLFDNAPCAMGVLDSTGLVVDANAELLRVTGLERDAVVGRRTLPSLVTVGGRIYFDTHLFPLLLLQGAVHEVAMEVVRPDGARVPVLLNANLAAEEVGATGPAGPTRVRFVLLEARDRRRYENDLLEAVRAAEDARRAAAELAQVLQQTLIPPTPPSIDGLDVAAAYRPAGDGSAVGGDFYDVFQVADSAWIVVVGDVLGKGVRAATVTALVRHTVRGLAMQVADPAELLRRLDRVVRAEPNETFCSLVVVRLTRRGDDWHLLGSLGGHPFPLVRHRDGSVEEVGTPGSLVGIVAEPTFTSFERLLGDDVICFFTDGVVEARRSVELFGEARLARLLSEGAGGVSGIVTSVVDAALAFQDGDARDDIAVLALARTAT